LVLFNGQDEAFPLKSHSSALADHAHNFKPGQQATAPWRGFPCCAKRRRTKEKGRAEARRVKIARNAGPLAAFLRVPKILQTVL
jgi:hypothetical protein